MIDIKLIRENPDFVRQAAAAKGVEVDVDKLVELDKEVRRLKTESEAMRQKQKQAGKDIAKAKGEEKQRLIAAMKDVADQVKRLNERLAAAQEELRKMLLLVPNPALPEVPVGASEEENVVVKVVEGTCPKMDFEPKDYLELAEACDIIDVERAGKVSGSRFGYLKREAALMEFALVQLAFHTLVQEGFCPMAPPVMIKPEPMEAMGYLTRGYDEVYRVQDNLFLVGTSEQSTGPYHMGEILEEEELPKRYVSFSTCFRREAGAHGKDTRGILRVHQFDKVEMFSFCRPDDSRREHQFLISMEEKLVQALGLPYRLVQMCTGDLGDPAANKNDIECWMPGQGQYRETHSCSNCTDFQARRLKVRYRRREDGAVEPVHTLNGTAFAIGRTLIAIIENYQQADGSILVPEALRPYMAGQEVIPVRK